VCVPDGYRFTRQQEQQLRSVPRATDSFDSLNNMSLPRNSSEGSGSGASEHAPKTQPSSAAATRGLRQLQLACFDAADAQRASRGSDVHHSSHSAPSFDAREESGGEGRGGGGGGWIGGRGGGGEGGRSGRVTGQGQTVGSTSCSISDFRIIRKLGTGRASKVYHVQHVESGQELALKCYVRRG
jgi:hypothetical protein